MTVFCCVEDTAGWSICRCCCRYLVRTRLTRYGCRQLIIWCLSIWCLMYNVYWSEAWSVAYYCSAITATLWHIDCASMLYYCCYSWHI